MSGPGAQLLPLADAARRQRRPVYELLRLAVAGELRLCIHGGGRVFVAAAVTVSTEQTKRGRQSSTRTVTTTPTRDPIPDNGAGRRNIFEALAVPADALARLEATGEAVPTYFDACEPPDRLLIPSPPFAVRIDDLWALADEIGALPKGAAALKDEPALQVVRARIEAIKVQMLIDGEVPEHPPRDKGGKRTGAYVTDLRSRMLGLKKQFPNRGAFDRAWEALLKETKGGA